MSIVRGPRPDSEFYILDKSISEDPRLGWGARGLLIFLLGKPDHWEVSIAHLVKQTETAGRRSGRDQIYGFLKELEQAGYIHKRPKRAEGGAFAGTEYVVTEQPRHTENPEPAPHPENPETAQPPLPDLPLTDKPLTANPTQVSNESLAKTEKSAKTEKKTTRASQLPSAFEPNDTHHRIARELGVHLAFELQQFKDHHRAKGSTFKDWNAALRTWIRNAAKFQAQKNPQGGNPAGNMRDKQGTPRPRERITDASLYGKNYAQGATTDEQLPEYLRH